MYVEVLAPNIVQPTILITENDNKLILAYKTTRDLVFKLINKQDSNNYYVFIMEKTGRLDKSTDCGFDLPGTTIFDFKYIDAVTDIHTIGSLVIDDSGNLIRFNRNPAISKIEVNNKPKKTENTGTIANINIGPGGVKYPVTISTQEFNQNDSVRQSTTGGNSINPIINLSSDSFDVENGTISVSCPEMKIGVIENSSLRIDVERQEAQNAFLETMSKKHNIQRKKSNE